MVADRGIDLLVGLTVVMFPDCHDAAILGLPSGYQADSVARLVRVHTICTARPGTPTECSSPRLLDSSVRLRPSVHFETLMRSGQSTLWRDTKVTEASRSGEAASRVAEAMS
jgi:hypothetical protein